MRQSYRPFISLVDTQTAKDPESASRFILNIEDPEVRNQLLSTAADHLVNVDYERALGWAENLPADKRDAAMGSVIGGLAQLDPKLAASRLESLIAESDGGMVENGLTKTATSIARTWSALEPEKATQWASSLPDAIARTNAVNESIGNWIADDSLASSKWIGDLPSGDVRDVAVSKLVENVASDDPEAGFIWAASIDDRNLREHVMLKAAQKWKSEDKDAVRKAVIEGNFSEGFTEKLLNQLN